MAYNDKASQWSITKESTYGDMTANAADLVELINPNIDPATEMIDREILKNSLVKAKPITGKETCSGSMEVEVSTASGAAGSKTINGSLLYESAYGNKIDDEEASACTVAAGVVTFDTAADVNDYKVGQVVKLVGNANGPEYATVRSITVDTEMTVAPTPSDDGTSCGGLLTFTVARPEAEQISLAIQEYLEGNNRVEYTYGGLVVSDVDTTFPVANIVKSNFSIAGAGFSVKEDGIDGATVANRDPACFSNTPYVAKNMTFKYNGTAYDVSGLNIKVASDIYDTEAITTAGITNKTTTGKSEIGGAFDLEYTGTSLFNAFKAGTSGELFGTVSNANSTAVVYAPNVVLTSSSKSIDSGIYKESLNYACLSSEACSADYEDAISLGFE